MAQPSWLSRVLLHVQILPSSSVAVTRRREVGGLYDFGQGEKREIEREREYAILPNRKAWVRNGHNFSSCNVMS